MADPTLIDGRGVAGGAAQPVVVMNQQMPQATAQAVGAATSAKQDTQIALMTPTKTVVTATITSGQTASAAVDLGGSSICGLIMPAALTGTSLSIQGCDTLGGTYSTLYDSAGNAETIAFNASRYHYIYPLITAGWQYIKITSTGAEGADRAIKLLTRPV